MISNTLDCNLDRFFFGDLDGWRTGENFRFDVAQQAKEFVESFPQGTVPILSNRDYATVVAMAAAIIANKSFVSIDPNQPSERLDACINQLGLPNNVLPAFSQISTIYPKQKMGHKKGGNSLSALASSSKFAMNSESLAYILFTSGSTGIPKGVRISDSNLENTILWGKEIFSWKPSDVIGIVANPFFDISIFDIFTSLYFGIPMFYLSDPSNIEKCLDEISDNGITTLFSAPVFFSQIVRSGAVSDPRLSKLIRIISGGDFFPPLHILSWRNKWKELNIYNVWGPTETSIVNSAHLVDTDDEKLLQEGRSPSIGESTNRMKIEIHDQNGLVVPDNVEGELVVIGNSVGLGYLDEMKILDSGFFNLAGEPAFRTKDLGFRDESGSLFMTGRSGFLAKINGFRIDLREIESRCIEIAGVSNCVAFPHIIGDGITELIAFIEHGENKANLNIADVKEWLRLKLPVYMVPKKVYFMHDFPVARTGKIDRKELIANFLKNNKV
jgi:acyl-coenzyme A synthetase/AMP-(fatty) acid ligase